MEVEVRRSLSAGLLVSLIALTLPAGASADESVLSSRLQILAAKDLRNASHAEQALAVSLLANGPGSLERSDGGLLVEVRVDGNEGDRADALAEAGAAITHISRTYDTITAIVDEADLRAVADVGGVEYVEEVLAPMTGAAEDAAAPGAINTCATGVVSEGNTQLNAGAARSQFDVDGSGVKVGVLSDSYDTRAAATTHAADDVGTANLPGAANPCGRTEPVQVIADSPGQSDEGRAMLQIVHDIAPGASLAFATAQGGQTVFADNIRALAAAGADVITDDLLYFREPIFQDGVIAEAINDVTAQGVSYFTMGYNSNRIISGRNVNSWMAPAYRPTPCPAAVPAGGDCMNFATSGGPDNMFQVTLAGHTADPPPNSTGTLRLNLDWAEPQFGVTTNFDFYVLDAAGNTVLLSSTDINATSGRPNELISGVSASAVAQNLQLVIKRVSGAGTPPISWINPDNVASSFSALPEYTSANSTDTFGPTIYGHNGAAAAETVAAVPFNNSAVIENFSARGPVTHYFQPVDGTTPSPAFTPPQVLNKPDISATDGGITTFFGNGNRFFGTSASAPHAAAVAALQLEANAALTPEDVKNAQEATARSVGGLPQTTAGAGLIDAQAAIANRPPTGPSVAITARPGPATTDVTPTFEFSAAGDVASFSCTVDAAASPCTSPFTTLALGDGNHTVAITATDFFGQSSSPAAASFTVDTTGPAAPTFNKGPKKKTKSRKATFTFAGEPGATFMCGLDDKLFKPCTSPAKVKVKKAKPKPKKHTFAIEATDALGNAGDVAVYKWKVVKKK